MMSASPTTTPSPVKFAPASVNVVEPLASPVLPVETGAPVRGFAHVPSRVRNSVGQFTRRNGVRTIDLLPRSAYASEVDGMRRLNVVPRNLLQRSAQATRVGRFPWGMPDG